MKRTKNRMLKLGVNPSTAITCVKFSSGTRQVGTSSTSLIERCSGGDFHADIQHVP